MRFLVAFASLSMCATGLYAADTAADRLQDSAVVLREIMGAPDKGIPHDLLEKARCIMIVPGLKKGAFIVGGEYGKGFAMCRRPGSQQWGAPAAITMSGGSFGFQIGGSDTDVVVLAMNQRGMERLMSDKFQLGADASVAAGPVGRTAQAETDLELRAEMLSWSRSRGVFAGISLNGAVVKPDQGANEQLYGHKMSNRDILASNMRPPAAARELIAELNRYSPHREGSGTAARERH
ncbi:MAG TPA: lipid-binding SYLF domain-containing protein [Bryobacteraceae bacterium]|nr:lipid-binding SYLF domain-containing protein [Bryobacteraceae bacterium]